MVDETVPRVTVVVTNQDGDFQLSGRERRLIGNFRAMKAGAQEMLIDLSDQYKRTLPARPTKLRLLRPAEQI